jgi:hypothetical protein
VIGDKTTDFPMCLSDFLWVFTRPPTFGGGGLGYSQEEFMGMSLRRMETLLRKADEKKGGPVPFPDVQEQELNAEYEQSKRDGEDLRRSLGF